MRLTRVCWRWLALFGGAGATALALYWSLILAEGSYFGYRAVRLIYRLGAKHYDRVRGFPAVNDQHELGPFLAEALVKHSNPWVLDLATGTGRVPLVLARQPEVSAHVVGLDLTPQMLAYARSNHSTECPDYPIEWGLAEAGAIPLQSERFALAVCLEALEFFPRPRQALAELARVLQPGGCLLISKYPDRWARWLPGRGFTEQALRHELIRLGFITIEVHPWQPDHYDLVLAEKAR